MFKEFDYNLFKNFHRALFINNARNLKESFFFESKIVL